MNDADVMVEIHITLDRDGVQTTKWGGVDEVSMRATIALGMLQISTKHIQDDYDKRSPFNSRETLPRREVMP